MSLASGNTFGAELWSDNKMIAPMLPEVSYVQKCPHCGKYYIISRQEMKWSDGGYSFELGLLSWTETKEAFLQLSTEGFLNEEEENAVRTMAHFAYNDYYYRSGESRTISKEDYALFTSNALWLIDRMPDGLLKAEFYREIGMMDKARAVLNASEPTNAFEENLRPLILKRIDNNDDKVFRIR